MTTTNCSYPDGARINIKKGTSPTFTVLVADAGCVTNVTVEDAGTGSGISSFDNTSDATEPYEFVVNLNNAANKNDKMRIRVFEGPTERDNYLVKIKTKSSASCP
ncbi:MAG: hypothetical protein D6679_09105 [Candidatus Hydrogenedentota bacterium]|nr:MAG: hypothetical protein D6679_09105 [Candidatus Hydrogenedentota bacterium]